MKRTKANRKKSNTKIIHLGGDEDKNMKLIHESIMQTFEYWLNKSSLIAV